MYKFENNHTGEIVTHVDTDARYGGLLITYIIEKADGSRSRWKPTQFENNHTELKKGD
ncbi:MAG: hypothetical protein KAS32_30185 [Candidatus Peribacteraceae bacterium]|nr:hypothetical protein [Candidatus Peribacteraceae bacterium]